MSITENIVTFEGFPFHYRLIMYEHEHHEVYAKSYMHSLDSLVQVFVPRDYGKKTRYYIIVTIKLYFDHKFWYKHSHWRTRRADVKIGLICAQLRNDIEDDRCKDILF